MSIFGRGSGSPSPTPSSPSLPPRPQPPSEPERRPARQGASGGPTHVAAGTRMHGKVLGTADVQVDGDLEGLIQVDADVNVGVDGRVKGDIEARSIKIAGTVAGNLKGHDRVEILGSGKLQGDVSAPRVILAEGAFFRGNVEMTGGHKAGSRPAEPGEPKGEGPKSESGKPEPNKSEPPKG